MNEALKHNKSSGYLLQSPHIWLSAREMNVAILLLHKLTPEQISTVINRSSRTVRYDIKQMQLKFKADSPEELISELASASISFSA